jgi:hypothetical protein
MTMRHGIQLESVCGTSANNTVVSWVARKPTLLARPSQAAWAEMSLRAAWAMMERSLVRTLKLKATARIAQSQLNAGSTLAQRWLKANRSRNLDPIRD